MCTVTVKVDKAVLSGIRPELNTTAAIRQWAQQQIDMCIQQMTAGQEGNESQEDLWCAVEQDKELTLMPSEIVCDGGEAVDLETFRADLHKMIDKVYEES